MKDQDGVRYRRHRLEAYSLHELAILQGVGLVQGKYLHISRKLNIQGAYKIPFPEVQRQ